MSKRRTFATAFIIFLVIAFVLSFAFIVAESDHHCTGEACPICHMIEICMNVLTGNIGIGSIGIFAVLFVVARIIRWVSHVFTLKSQTLISLKVKFNN